ncbi:hypothetical protein Drorol1_Dr00012262 [Drosera rotundifolia]
MLMRPTTPTAPRRSCEDDECLGMRTQSTPVLPPECFGSGHTLLRIAHPRLIARLYIRTGVVTNAGDIIIKMPTFYQGWIDCIWRQWKRGKHEEAVEEEQDDGAMEEDAPIPFRLEGPLLVL